ncbi:MAG: recombinase family protein, partial [Alphaproteobacteria bacterium]|nr:recombinase family protein [Alphaproteobacteria bacterium]
MLYQIIKQKHESSMGYGMIAEWLNENGYTTPRGHEFKNTQVFSNFKKNKLRDKRLNITHKFEIKNTSLIVLEIP